MKPLMIAAVMLAARAVHAEPGPDHCAAGIDAAKRGDLARASIYLDACTGDDAEAAAASVAKQLRASQLSALTITSAGLTVETDALPGETFASGTTVWAKAGTYHIKASAPDGRSVEATVKLGAHSRATVVMPPLPKTPGAKDGKADFTDEPIDPPHAGPPPAIKHPSLLPCKYDGCDTHGGEFLVDPLARRDEFLPPHPAAYRVGVRAGVGAASHAGSSRIGPSLALDLRAEAPWQDLGERHPFEFDVRADWSRRGGDDARFDAFAASLGIDRVLADPDAAWISAGVAARGELRAGAPMQVDAFGISATATLELALRKLPIVVGAAYEQGITELMPGVREHAIVVELGVDWRTFHDTR